MREETFDLYSDYLICSFGQATATGMVESINASMSHDEVTRALSSSPRDGVDLWRKVKPIVRKMQGEDGIMIVDDTIAAKPHSDENELVCWHYDHTTGTTIKGIGLVSCLYCSNELALPIDYRLIAAIESYRDKKTGEQKRRSLVNKNEHYRNMLMQAKANGVPFKYVLNDVWFASAENMNFVKHTLGKMFVMPLKANRNVALSATDKRQGIYVSVDAVEIKENAVLRIFLEDVSFPMNLVKQIFHNKDGSTGVLYLVTNDLTLNYDGITSLYKKRWAIEPYHKSLKQNAALERSPAHTVRTQSNHICASLCAYIKLECLKTKTDCNHFALKSRLYIRAVRSAFDTLASLQPVRLAA